MNTGLYVNLYATGKDLTKEQCEDKISAAIRAARRIDIDVVLHIEDIQILVRPNDSFDRVWKRYEQY